MCRKGNLRFGLDITEKTDNEYKILIVQKLSQILSFVSLKRHEDFLYFVKTVVSFFLLMAG